MKELIILDLENVDRAMIICVRDWLESKEYNSCPFNDAPGGCEAGCDAFFENLDGRRFPCPCSVYGEANTVMAFAIACDVWEGYFGGKDGTK